MKKGLIVGVVVLLLALLFVPQALAADDTTAPALTGFNLNSTSFNRGDTLTVSVIATELESGFDLTRCRIGFLIKNPIEYEPCLDYFDIPLDTLCEGGVQGSIVLDERVGGTYEVSGVTLTDMRGNVSTYADYYENLPELTYTLVSDYTKPGPSERLIVTSYTMSKKTAKPGDTVTYTIAGSYSTGIVQVDMSLFLPNTEWSPNYKITMTPVAGKANTFSGTFTVPADMYDGFYYPQPYFITGSGERVSPFNLAEFGETRLKVVNPSVPLPDSPKFISYSVSTHTVYAGQQVTVSLTIDPKYSPQIQGVSAWFGWIGTDTIVRPMGLSVRLSDQGNGVYTGTSTIPVTARPGEYGLGGFTALITKSDYIVGFKGNDSDYLKSNNDVSYLINGRLTVNSPLSVSGTENVSILVGETFDAMAGVSASNALTGDITAGMTVIGGDIDTSAPGIYLIKYILSDTITIEGISYPVSYTDYRWIGVSEVMPQGTGAPLVVTDGSIDIGVESSEATLTKDGVAIAFTNTISSPGNYVISTSASSSTDSTSVVYAPNTSDVGHAFSLAASDMPVIVTELNASPNSSVSDTSSASMLIDKTGPAISPQCYIDSAMSITVRANASDVAGIALSKWAKGEQSVSYFAVSGTVFSGSFVADSYGKYTVYSKDVLGNASVTVVDVQPIGIPGAIKASTVVNGSNAISWNSVSGASGYQVSRTTSAGGAYTPVTETTSKKYIDAASAQGQTCYYIVRAYKVSGNARIYGAASMVASVTNTSSTPVAAAAMASYNSVKISWNVVSGASGYQVYRATSQNGSYSLIKSTSSLSYTNTSIGTGTTYYYKVRAYGYANGSKVYGNYSIITAATPMLSSVASATASAYYPTSVKISWSSVPGRTKYEVWRSTTPTGGFGLIKSTTSTYYKDTTCTPFVTYYYQIRVYRTVSGQKVYGSSTSPTASATPILGNVTGVGAAMSSPSSNKVSWASVTGASGYEVWRSTTADSGYVLVKSTSSRSYTDSNLIPNTTYYYQVRAYRKVGGSPVPSALSAPVSATPYFRSVLNPKAVRSSATKIKLTWSAVSGRTGYEVYRSTLPDSGFVLIKSTTSTSFTDSGLTTGVTYYYKICAYRTVNGVKYRSTDSVIVSATP